ncbi:SDR family NAD(P)-dependent oxidoreductase [Rhodococcus sp. OK302]|uniref:SDR family NAD(P)-dependent oxidoreductase n=1 Tax=Rhodococcus sp. OK302 TaxID=1882769 RepID=UPI000B93A899|nr:SDR family oxidoreductase [Rhodococcus sp. OK302]
MRLRDKVAVVTGAGNGLGRAIAIAMAREGAHVAALDISETGLKQLKEDLAGEGLAVMTLDCDVSDVDQVNESFDAVTREFGTVHVLVNNAALVPSAPKEAERRARVYEYFTQPVPRRSLGVTRELTDDDWLKWWGVNVHSVFYCTRAALQHMEPQGWGRIVNIASIAALGAASAHSPGYSASKAAVASFTKTVALDVAGANVLVNCIAPGAVVTPPFKEYLESATDEEQASLAQLFPIGRFGDPEEYANVAVFLASEDHYITGQVISPNGGMVI